MAAETEPEIGGIVLAAGEGARFGGPKQLAELDGRPLLEHAFARCSPCPRSTRSSSCSARTPTRSARRSTCSGAESSSATDWADGQSASLRAGLARAAATPTRWSSTLGDQPCITPQVIAARARRSAAGDRAVRATYDGAPGPPRAARAARCSTPSPSCAATRARATLLERPRRVYACEAGRPRATRRDVDTPERPGGRVDEARAVLRRRRADRRRSGRR